MKRNIFWIFIIQALCGFSQTAPFDYQLAISGNILASKVVVKNSTNWPDYVFKPDYTLPSLCEVEQYIKINGHLQDIPNEKEIADKGIDVGSIEEKLLKKVEELTLYLIQQQKRIEELEEKVKQIKK